MLGDTLSTLIFITGFLRTFNRYIITMDSQAPLQIHLMRISGGGTQALLFFLSFPGGLACRICTNTTVMKHLLVHILGLECMFFIFPTICHNGEKMMINDKKRKTVVVCHRFSSLFNESQF